MPWNQLWPTSCTVTYSGSGCPGRANTVSPPVVTNVGYSMPPAPVSRVDRRVDDGHASTTGTARSIALNCSIAPIAASR